MKIDIEVSEKVILHLLSSALEGVSNRWITHIEETVPVTSPCTDKEYWRWLQGISITVEGKQHTLSQSKIESGLITMAQNDPVHFVDVISGNGDEITGDVYLQHCLFGEVVYS